MLSIESLTELHKKDAKLKKKYHTHILPSGKRYSHPVVRSHIYAAPSEAKLKITTAVVEPPIKKDDQVAYDASDSIELTGENEGVIYVTGEFTHGGDPIQIAVETKFPINPNRKVLPQVRRAMKDALIKVKNQEPNLDKVGYEFKIGRLKFDKIYQLDKKVGIKKKKTSVGEGGYQRQRKLGFF